MFSYTWLLQRLKCYGPTQFSGTGFGSENCKHGICALSWTLRTASLRPVSMLSQICTAWCRILQKHFKAIMEVFFCFTVAIGLPGDLSDYNEDKSSAVPAACKKGGCRVRQQWELGVRLWVFGPHWSSCKKIKMMHVRCFTAIYENKNFNVVLTFWCYLLPTLPPHLANWAVFQAFFF